MTKATLPQDAITREDVIEFNMTLADRPLADNARCCGYRVRPVLVYIQGHYEYALMCCICFTLWQTGVPYVVRGHEVQREAADRRLIEKARPWTDEAAWYIRQFTVAEMAGGDK